LSTNGQSNSGFSSPAFVGSLTGGIVAALVALAIFGFSMYKKRNKKVMKKEKEETNARMERLEEALDEAKSNSLHSKNTNSNNTGTNNSGATGLVGGHQHPSAAPGPDATFATLWTVVDAYTPVMEDEVALRVGDFVVLETIYK
jgi:gas vesicle protein